MVEEQVLHFIKQQNRPFNTQLVADNLAQFGLKKGPIQKALDSLSEASKIKCKEFGKTKIYMAVQDKADQLDKEDTDKKTALAAALTEKVKADGEVIRDLKTTLKDAKNAMTEEELDAKLEELQRQVTSQEKKLQSLQSGAILIPPEKKAAADQKKDARRNTISENVEGKQADLFEEIGIDLDETVGVDYKQLELLMPRKRRR